jgi:hypothetical protein
MLFGIVKGYPTQRFRLTTTYADLDESSTILVVKLPEIEALEAQIIDENGESKILRADVTISKDPSKTWL